MSGSYRLKTEVDSKQLIAQSLYLSPITKVVEFFECNHSSEYTRNIRIHSKSQINQHNLSHLTVRLFSVRSKPLCQFAVNHFVFALLFSSLISNRYQYKWYSPRQHFSALIVWHGFFIRSTQRSKTGNAVRNKENHQNSQHLVFIWGYGIRSYEVKQKPARKICEQPVAFSGEKRWYYLKKISVYQNL